MKKIILFSVFFFAVLSGVQAQCEITDLTNKCTQRLKPNGFKYLRSYKLDFLNGSKKQIMYSYVFGNGTSYMLTLANQDRNNKGLVVTLLDSEKRQVASSYSSKDKRYLSGLEVKCNRSGIYYFAFSVEEGKDNCGSSVLGFKR